MPVSTRTQTAKIEAKMDEALKQIMEMMKAMNKGQEEMKEGQEEIKRSQDAMKTAQEDMKTAQEDMKNTQEDMKNTQEDMKDNVSKQFRDMKDDVRRQLEEQGERIDQQVSEIVTKMKTDIDTRFETMEKVVEETIVEFKDEVGKEITDMKKEVGKEIIDIRKEMDSFKSKFETQAKYGSVRPEEYHNQTSAKIKPPTFDGKTSWQTYMKQFEAAAFANNWTASDKATALIVSLRGDALEVLQTLTEDKHRNYEDLVLHLEMRFGDKHLQQVYQAQLRGRTQKINETLQQYEADIARLVHLAYPTAPQDFMEQLAVQIFIDGIRDCDTQQALRLARCKQLTEVLAYALEFEAAKQASRGHTRVRQVRTRTPDRKTRWNYSNGENIRKDSVEKEIENLRKDFMEKLDTLQKNVGERKSYKSFGPRNSLECWNCGEKGHIRTRCPRLSSEGVSTQHETTDQENSN